MDRPPPVRFGPFLLERDPSQLSRDGVPVEAPSKALDVIAHLVDHPGQILTREQLLEAVWPDVYVSDDALSQMLRKARVALEDDARQPRYIETVHRRGYRFIAEVLVPTEPAAPPHPRDAFIGREAELAALDRLWHDGARCVTVLGTGGAGKTRLALEHVRRAEHWPWVLEVDVSAARSQEALAAAVAGGLGVPLITGDTSAVVDQVGRALAHRGAGLVLLDNTEQLGEALPRPLAGWQELAPDVRWLTTSRVRHGIGREYEIPPLSPEDGRRLFLDRARNQGAALGDEWREEVEALAADLGGSPLAIELAAVRAPLLDPAAIRARLGEQLALLSDHRKNAPRHRSIQASIRWSWGLMAPFERAVLRQLSLFAGGFSVQMAEVVADPGSGAPPVIDVVQSLRDQWMIQPEVSQARPVAGLLRLAPSVREFAAEQLHTEHPARQRFVDLMLSFEADSMALALDARPDVGERLSRELDNLRAACTQARDPEQGCRLATVAGRVLAHHGRRVEAVAVLDPWVGRDDLGPATRDAARFVLWSSRLPLRTLGARERREVAETAAGAEGREDLSTAADLHRAASEAYRLAGRMDRARQSAMASVALARRLGDGRRLAAALLRAAVAELGVGRFEQANGLVREGLAACPPGRGRNTRSRLAGLAGYLAAQRGDYGQAQRWYEACLRDNSDIVGGLQQRVNLASVWQEAGRFEEALALQNEVIGRIEPYGLRLLLCQTLLNRGLTHLHLGDLVAAERDLLHAASLDGSRYHRLMIALNRAALECVRGGFSAALDQVAAVLDAERQPPEVARADALLWRCVAAVGLGDLDTAHAALGALEALDAGALPHFLAASIAPARSLVLAATSPGERERHAAAVRAALDSEIPVVVLVARAAVQAL